MSEYYDQEWTAPLYPIREIVDLLNAELPHMTLSVKDLTEPMEVDKVQTIYIEILKLFGFNMDEVLQVRQFDSIHCRDYPELYDNANYTVYLTQMIDRILVSCGIKDDFIIFDMVNPRVKRTQRFLSAIINFYLFYKLIQEEHYTLLKNEVIDTNQHFEQLRMKNYAAMMEIEKLKISKVENETEAQKLKELVDCIHEDSRHKADIEKELKKKGAEVKAQIAEERSKHALIMTNLATKQEEMTSLKKLVGQSPDRMKLESIHLHNRFSKLANEHEQKVSRLVELKSKCEKKSCPSEKIKGLSFWVCNIQLDMEKERLAEAEFSKEIEQTKEQFMIIRDVERRETSLKNEIESIHAKTQKMELQYEAQIKSLKNDIAELKTDETFQGILKQLLEIQSIDKESKERNEKELMALEAKTNHVIEVTKDCCAMFALNLKNLLKK